MALGYKRDEIGTKRLREIGWFLDKRSVLDMKGRCHLKGKDVEPFRRKIFERSGGQCEKWRWYNLGGPAVQTMCRCMNTITWETMEMHHSPSGYARYDSMESVKGICHECHIASHNREPQLKSIPNCDVPR